MHNRLAFVDTLRGIAVLSVILQHVLEHIVLTGQTGPYEGMLHGLIGYYFNFGRFGVVLFFFVSGFVVPYSFPDSSTPVRDFAISRFFRLYPMYWLAIVLAVAILPVTEGKVIPGWQLAVNLTMFQNLVGVPNIAVAHWTLAIELIFYIGCALLFILGLLQRSIVVFGIVVAISLAGIILPSIFEQRIVSRLLEVVLNIDAMLIGKVIRDTVLARRLQWWHVAICLGAYCAFAVVIFHRLYGATYQDFFFSYSIAAAYVVAGLVFLGFASFGDRLASRILSFIGRISYSVYLMQVYVLTITLYYFGAGSTLPQWLLFAVGVVAATVLLSWGTYALVEKPAIAFGRRFRSRREAGSGTLSTVQRSVA
jgi:peptidoglycan/LPS O-acetylase OafA/YrhL